MAKPLHVVMLPWSAFGHLMPFFQLSVGLAKSGVEVSFISTPTIIQRLPKPPPNVATLINFVGLSLPSLGNNELLPEGAEATLDFPSFDQIKYLKIAYDLLQPHIRQFVAEQSPDWIVSDFFTHWVVNIAQEYQVPLLHFSVFSASFYDFLGPHFLVDNITNVRPSGISDKQRVGRVIHGCRAMAIRSCPEYEGHHLDLLEKVIGKPVIPVGLLTPENVNGRDQITDERWRKIFRWLDEQKPKSVVFVGFGSECKLTKDQVWEIGYGVELSGLPFLWALRKPEWASDDLDCLPPGFYGRVQGKGMVSIGWAPQLEILGHSSIGGSLFHAGWGSMIETLQFGHCLVVLPFIVDQPLNARVLVDKVLAVEVERSEDGSFTRDGIAKALRQVMVSEEGEKLRAKAREATGIFNNKKLQEDYFGRFVEYLKTNVVKKQVTIYGGNVC